MFNTISAKVQYRISVNGIVSKYTIINTEISFMSGAGIFCTQPRSSNPETPLLDNRSCGKL